MSGEGRGVGWGGVEALSSVLLLLLVLLVFFFSSCAGGRMWGPV